VLDFYKQRFESSGITVESHYSSHLHIPVYAGRLRQLFSNLLLNALEATPQGGKIHAHVSAGHDRSGQQRTGVRVTVADNGSGIPQGMLSQIFERAFTMKPGGHGMGLALVKDVVKKHDGLLRVRSNTKSGRQGTVFSIFLPSA
jgi:signal transduction histidine kinase